MLPDDKRDAHREQQGDSQQTKLLDVTHDLRAQERFSECSYYRPSTLTILTIASSFRDLREMPTMRVVCAQVGGSRRRYNLHNRETRPNLSEPEALVRTTSLALRAHITATHHPRNSCARDL